MSTPVSSISALRQLLSERFPQAARAAMSALPTGIPKVDEAASGGLPRQALTELVCAAPSCGSQLFIGQLLHVVRNSSGRAALIESADSFDPASWPADDLRALVWVRSRIVAQAMTLADLFARDANLDLVLLDLRAAAASELRRIPARTWYRLQRAMEQTNAALLVLTPTASVPSAQLRLTLEHSLSFNALTAERVQTASRLDVAVHRQRVTSTLAVG